MRRVVRSTSLLRLNLPCAPRCLQVPSSVVVRSRPVTSVGLLCSSRSFKTTVSASLDKTGTPQHPPSRPERLDCTPQNKRQTGRGARPATSFTLLQDMGLQEPDKVEGQAKEGIVEEESSRRKRGKRKRTANATERESEVAEDRGDVLDVGNQALNQLKPGKFWNRARSPRVMVIHPYLKGRRQRKVVAGINVGNNHHNHLEEEVDYSGLDYPELRLTEAVALVEALGWSIGGDTNSFDSVDSAYKMIVNMSGINGAHFFGRGKIEELQRLISQYRIDVVVIDTNLLTPTQTQNLAQMLNCRIMDRFRLILEIFASRAQTLESKLQVELASIPYQRSHITTALESEHLAQQRGGGAFLAGAGETMLEVERRKLADREKKIRDQLEQIAKNRQLHRQARKNNEVPTVAVVGYTNAGKSALINRLGRSNLVSKDQLFASLQTFMRKVPLPSGNTILAADTVGFISNLPHALVAPFRSTLEDIRNADLLLHIRDITNEETEMQAVNVNLVLEQLELDPALLTHNHIEVWNKIDRLAPADRKKIEELAKNNNYVNKPFLISALTGEGCGELLAEIDNRIQKMFSNQTRRYVVVLDSGKNNEERIAFLYKAGKVKRTAQRVHQNNDNNDNASDDTPQIEVEVEMPVSAYQKYCLLFGEEKGTSAV